MNIMEKNKDKIKIKEFDNNAIEEKVNPLYLI